MSVLNHNKKLKVVNDLTTGGVNDALSSEQGKELNERINNIPDLIISEQVISDANTAATNANTVATNVANAEAARVLDGAALKTDVNYNSYSTRNTLAPTRTNKAIKADGTLQESVYYTCYELVSFDVKNKYYHSGRYLVDTGYIRIAFYDQSGTFISGQAPLVSTTYLDELITNIPNNTAFISICNGSNTTGAYALVLKVEEYIAVALKTVVKQNSDEILSLRTKCVTFENTAQGLNLIDPENYTDGKYLGSSAGELYETPFGFTTGYIAWGTQNMIKCKKDNNNTSTFYYSLQYDSNYNPIAASYQSDTRSRVLKYTGATYIRVTLFVFNDLTWKNPFKWMLYFGMDTTVNFEPYYKLSNSDSVGNKAAFYSKSSEIRTIIRTVKRLGTSGDDADYCGLNAIGECLASITDASYYKRYKIVGDGVFIFTDPTTITYLDPIYSSPSVIVGKDYVDIEGISKDKFIVSIEFSTSTTFPSGKHYYDYQPVMWNANSKLSNITAIAKNCRYAIHFEGSTAATNNTEDFENCRFIQLGNVDMGGSYQDCIGMGIRDGQTINFRNCEIIANISAFGIHTALDQTVRGATVNFIDCVIDGTSMHFDSYPNDRQVLVNFINTIFSKATSINYKGYLPIAATSVSSDYSWIKIKMNKHILFNNVSFTNGLGLRIKSKSTGVASIVSINPTCTAFNSIIGISTLAINVENGNCWNTTYGYFYKNGGVGLSGQLVGGIDIDSATPHTSLGKKLGDCSITNKTLTLTIDGTTYNVVFNTNLTSSTNAQVIALITAVIGSVADVDTYSIGREYYPDFDGVLKQINADTTAILKGSGVIFLTSGSMRLALNSDNRIDGICLDDVAVGSRGRVLTKGSLYSLYKANLQRFTINSVQTTTVAIGTEFGISAATAGLFDSTAIPKLLRAIDTDIIKIL